MKPVEPAATEIEVNWVALARWHRLRSKSSDCAPARRVWHRQQAVTISAALKKKKMPLGTGRISWRHGKNKNDRMKYNSNCIECGKPAMAPKGNFHAKSVTLCKRPQCRRRRKTALQKERRKQKIMKFIVEGNSKNLKVIFPKTSKQESQAWKSGSSVVPVESCG